MRRSVVLPLALLAALAPLSRAAADEVEDGVKDVSGKVAEIAASMSRMDGLPREIAGAPQALLGAWQAHVASLGPNTRMAVGPRTREIFAISPAGSAEIKVVALSDGATPAVSIKLKGPGGEPLEDALLLASGAPVVVEGRAVGRSWNETSRRFTPLPGKGRWLATEARSSGALRPGSPGRPVRTTSFVVSDKGRFRVSARQATRLRRIAGQASALRKAKGQLVVDPARQRAFLRRGPGFSNDSLRQGGLTWVGRSRDGRAAHLRRAARPRTGGKK